MNAGPVADQPVRPRTPPGVGTPLRALGENRVSAREGWAGEKYSQVGATRVLGM